MERLFRDRVDAGRRLAPLLTEWGRCPGALVLALPRGGVPVGAEVARALGLPLDVLVVRKLGVPGNPELAMGALASGGIVYRNEAVLSAFGVTSRLLHDAVTRESGELARRQTLYRGDRPPPAVAGRPVILVDDGVATGSTMRAAVRALRAQLPSDLVVAAPVIAAGTARALGAEVTRVVALLRPDDLLAVGQYYTDFRQTSDDEVRDLLAGSSSAARPPAATVPREWTWHYRTLRALRDHLMDGRGDRLRDTGEPLEPASTHGADFADEVHDRELAAALPADPAAALTEVEAAMHRITAGTYGVCLESGRPIPAAQLRACPWRTTTAGSARRRISHAITNPPAAPRRV
jgi:putative phosphoribosyl transferase